MNKNKNLWKKGVVVAAAAAMITGVVPSVNAFAYGAYDVSQSTFKTDTDNSADFQNWVSNVWQGGEGAFSGTDQVALTPGSDANDLNFGWYSEIKLQTAVMDTVIRILVRGNGSKSTGNRCLTQTAVQSGSTPYRTTLEIVSRFMSGGLAE